MYGYPRRNYDVGLTTAAFYGKGSGPSLTVAGKTWGFESESGKAKKHSTPIAMQLFDFETGMCEMNFDNFINIDVNKFDADFAVDFKGGIEAYSKFAMVEIGYNGISIPVPYSGKNIRIGAQYDLGSVGGGFLVSGKKGLKLGIHVGVGFDYTLTLE